MGLILDSSVVIAAERNGYTVEQLIERILRSHGPQQAGLSAVGLTEISHGVYRAKDPVRRSKREAFVEALLKAFIVHPYARSTALLAARIGGEQESKGVTIPFADLMIGATALELNADILTINVRHFRLIPGLRVLDV
jgi:predicted nucleic acid-binding protein